MSSARCSRRRSRPALPAPPALPALPDFLLRPHVRGEDLLAQSNARGCDLHQLIVVDEFDRVSRPRRRGGIRRMASSAVEARMLVCFFSFVTFTSMSFGRAFSPMIMP